MCLLWTILESGKIGKKQKSKTTIENQNTSTFTFEHITKVDRDEWMRDEKKKTKTIQL